jgi:DNA-binding response OmpR family regulator
MVRWLQEARYLPVTLDPAALAALAALGEPADAPALVDTTSAGPLVLVIAEVAQPRAAASLLRRLQTSFSGPSLLTSARFRRGLPRAAGVATELGVAAVLPKPFSRDELLAAVKATALAHLPSPPTG